MEPTLQRNIKLLQEIESKFPGSKNLMKYHLALNEIPRPSGHTAAATEWSVKVGKQLGGTTKVDKLGNVCIHFPATPGKESVPATIIQGHLDMVGTKTADHTFDFTKDQLEMFLDGDLLRARQTTLGADDATGIAVGLAIAEDKTITRGPLELLFTIDEEIGLVGACGLVEGELLSPQAKYLINIDSEDWPELCLSCAGAMNRDLNFPLHRKPLDSNWAVIGFDIKDFHGGHSGAEIHLGRGNAIKWGAFILADNAEIVAGCPLRIIDFEGGHAHNAIPSTCSAKFAVPSDKVDSVIAAMQKIFDSLISKWQHVETLPAKIVFKKDLPAASDALTVAASLTLARILEQIHHGPFKWSYELDNLVETSQSIATANLVGDKLTVCVFARSSCNDVVVHLENQLVSLVGLHHGTIEKKGSDLPGWPADPSSKLAKLSCEVFEREFKKPFKVVPVHAGLECGIIMNKYPKNKIESISIGPTVRNPHTPLEYVDVKTFIEVHQFTKSLVEELSK